MEYNSQKGDLVIPEYGRNIQNMIYTIREMEDPDKRQHLAEAVIELMQQMNPVDRSNPDYKDKLWRHLFRIADYKIDVKAPEGIDTSPESNQIISHPISYPEGVRKNRHYGKYVQVLIEKAVEMEPGEKLDEFVMIIAAYMKIAYRTCNREHYVSDEVIKSDLHKMSNGALSISATDAIEVTVTFNTRQKNNSRGRNNRGRNNRGRNNRGRNNRNNSRGRKR